MTAKTTGHSIQLKNRGYLAKWLINQTRGLLKPLAFSVLARIIGQLLNIGLFVGAAIALLRAYHRENSVGLIWTLVGIALAKALLRYGEQYAGHYVAFTSLEKLRKLYFAGLTPKAPAFTQGKAGAELTDRASNDIDRIEVFFAHTIPPTISALIVPTICLTWLGVSVDLKLVPMLLPLVVVTLALPFVGNKTTWYTANQVANHRGKVAEKLGDSIQGIREVLAFNLQKHQLTEISNAGDELADEEMQLTRLKAVRSAISFMVQSLTLAGLVWLWSGTNLSTTNFIVGLMVGVSIIVPSKSIDDFATGLDAAFAATERIHQIISLPPPIQEIEHPKPVTNTLIEPNAGQVSTEPNAKPGMPVVFEAVTFAYPGGQRNVLNKVDLEFRAADWTCVVGVSGSGKSTIANLILRGWDPQNGVVKVNNIDVKEASLASLRKSISLVPQRPILFSGTVRSNIGLINPSATDEQLAEAMHIAELDDWIDKLDQRIDEKGLNISGGQRQRFALARALVAKSKVLILDEALSQMDQETIHKIKTNLAVISTTVIEITHRVDLIEDEKKVYVIDAGTVVASGKAGQLRQSLNPFTRLELRQTRFGY